jgi:predicted amidohydrolase YtcJ
MVTRQDPFSADEGSFHGAPLSLEQAIQVMTINGAWSMGIDDTAGNIKVGKSADLIVLDHNPFDGECRGRLHQTRVDLTLLQGQLTWDRLGVFEHSPLQPVWSKSLPAFVADPEDPQ